MLNIKLPAAKAGGDGDLARSGPSSSSSSSSSTPVRRQEFGRRKVPLKKGFSQLDWTLLSTTCKDLAGRGGQPLRRDITLEELQQHNSRRDCWMALRGKVYNITRYLDFHPGGVDELMRGAGDDATEIFDEVHRWVTAEYMLQRCLIGSLAEHTLDPSSYEEVALHPFCWRPLQLVSIEQDSCPSSLRLRFALPSKKTLGFKGAGQHLQMMAEAKAGKVIRAYTPITLPSQTEYMELAVKIYPDGRLSQYCQQLKVGDFVSFRGPRGSFYYQRGQGAFLNGAFRPVKKFVMVAAGSGITPMLQLMNVIVSSTELDEREIQKDLEDSPEILLVNCNRSPSEVMCEDLLRQFKEKAPSRFQRVDVFSKVIEAEIQKTSESSEEIHRIYERLSTDLLMKLVPPMSEGTVLLYCGPPVFNELLHSHSKLLGYNLECAHCF